MKNLKNFLNAKSMPKLMTHIVAGYPSMEDCEDLAVKMANAGVGFIEIQIPFSDPVADGPTIMAANQKALESGVRVEDCFQLMERLNRKVELPLLFMSYFNILHSYGVDEFCERAKACGCYGLIVPDVTIDEEEFEGYLSACKKHDLKAIQIVSPLTSDERLKQIGDVAEGFVYCVSSFGTTGARKELNKNLADYLERVKQHVTVDLAVGFGISNREQVESVGRYAEIAVVGSAVINTLNESGGEKAADLIRELVQ